MVYGEILLMITSRIPPVVASALATTPLSPLLGPWPPSALFFVPLFPVILAVKKILARIEKEEKMLSEAFGDDWQVYKATVQWKMVPGLF